MIKKIFLFSFLAFFCQSSNASEYTIYLTFDDGPLGGTENILSILEEERVMATFFMVGIHMERYKNHEPLLKEIKNSKYILLGNHSYSHAFGHYTNFYRYPRKVIVDMKKNDRILGLGNGQVTYARLPGRNVFRLPGLYYDDPYISTKNNEHEQYVSNLIFNNDFYLFGWDYEWESRANGLPLQSVSKLLQEIEERLDNEKTMASGELILLMHDQMFREDKAKKQLQKLIIRLKKKGYRLANLINYTPSLSNIEGFTNAAD